MNVAPPYRPSAPPPQKSNLAMILIIVAVVLGVLVVAGGVLAVLGIYGVRKYVSNAKTAEARVTVTQIAKDAARAYEDDLTTVDGKPMGHLLCASASHPVPADKSAVSAKKYQSAPADWQADKGKNAGFACLKFEMTMPQYYQYDYRGTLDGFTAVAAGDLNGDGRFSEFKSQGKVVNETLQIAPALLERDPDE